MTKSILFTLLISHSLNTPLSQAAEVSVTMDDFNVHEDTLLTAPIRNQKILSSLKAHNAKAAFFAVGK
jgi:hypothetical protein